MKRAAPGHNDVSPPPTKRKVESTVTSKAVASFFKPASQKEPEQIAWRIVKQSLVIAKYDHATTPHRRLGVPVKIAAFDLDDTVIAPANSGNRWIRSATSWKWWDSCVPGRLRELHKEGYLVILVSNQSNIGLKDNPKKLVKDTLSLKNFKDQVSSVIRQLDVPISVYAATEHDAYRKPRTGMWDELKEDHDLEASGMIDIDGSFFVGDAAGRDKTDKHRKDHASSDRGFAANIGVKFYTPEEFFLGDEAEPFVHAFDPVAFLLDAEQKKSTALKFERKNTQDIVMFCGSPGSGKSSFYRKDIEPLGYERINQDTLKTRDRCLHVAKDLLKQGSSVVIDNTNADIETRAHWVNLARDLKIPIRCVRFTAPPNVCEHNAMVRAFNKELNPEGRTILPAVAFQSFAKRFVEPKLEEGFQDIFYVDFAFVGTDETRKLWAKHWVSKFST